MGSRRRDTKAEIVPRPMGQALVSDSGAGEQKPVAFGANSTLGKRLKEIGISPAQLENIQARVREKRNKGGQ